MNRSHKRALAGLFFLFGFGVMSLFPRFPEVKANLGVSNLLIGFGLSGFHISLNGQALHVQEIAKQNLMPRLHGVWSSGALSTAVISGLLAGRVSLELHITLLAIFNFAAGIYFLHILKPTLLVANGKKSQDIPVRSFFIKSRVDWMMGLALTCAVMLEAAVGDWAAIFSQEELNMSPGVAAIPYICLIGVQYMVALFIVKFGLAWTAQFASIGVALLIPAVALISLYFMADHLERAGV